MTLIATTSNYSNPIIVGDILMSSEQNEKKTQIPTFLGCVNNQLSTTQKLFPFSLRQKIYVITDSLALALAGSEFQMKLFLDDIRTNFHFKACTVENINEFMDDYDFSNFDQSACLLLYSEKTTQGIRIDAKTIGPWIGSKSLSFESVFACGTGSQYFIDNASKEMNYSHNGNNNQLNKAISLNYINLGELLGLERLSLDTIRQAWGAGFEMIYFDGERFRKMDDVTFILWKGNVNLDTGLYNMEPFLILNFSYFEDILIISATDMKNIEGYAVPPLYLTVEDFNQRSIPQSVHFKSKKVCSLFVLELSNGEILAPSFFAESQEYPGYVSADINDEGQIVVMIQQEFQDNFIKGIQQVVNDKKNNFKTSIF